VHRTDLQKHGKRKVLALEADAVEGICTTEKRRTEKEGKHA
jgi:hypothetical protein